MINKIKHHINELMNYDFFKINEMAHMGTVGQYTVVIESNDHNPPHFHLKINNKPITRIKIPLTLPTRTYDLVYVSKNATRLSSKVERDLIDWLKSPVDDIPTINNLKELQRQWNIIHPDSRFKWN